VYRQKGFRAADFGFSLEGKSLISKKQLPAFLVLFVLIILFDYFISGGTKPIRDGLFNGKQLVVGLPLVFIAMAIEAGLVEEFFFRALLQSRITQLLKSPVAGILISGLIFGLAHAPGLYLRGTGADQGLGQHPSVLFCITYCIVVLSSAGFFLGIVWQQTKNIYLIIILHALIDFLPNFPDFIRIWKL
jgi:membrane protease YdiL (CAAX protease family)